MRATVARRPAMLASAATLSALVLAAGGASAASTALAPARPAAAGPPVARPATAARLTTAVRPATAAHHRRRCTAHGHSSSLVSARTDLDAIWGWGWRAGPFLADASKRSSRHPGAARGCHANRKAHPRHGVAVSPPASMPAGAGTGSATGPASGSGSSGASGSGEPSTSTGAGNGEETTSPPAIPHVQVTAVEYHFTLSRTTVPAGKVVLEFVNAGQDEHNLNVLSGGGELEGQFPDTVSKGVRDQTLQFRHGSYTLFCSLPEHEAKGMHSTLTVE
jgi:hypothetical protein